jgi:predicted short-subunit dehydrogenase-like oxidoreductase (DUF2520 family)
MDVAVVGAGRVGTALAVLLARAGHRLVAVSGRDATRTRTEKFLPGVPFLPSADAVRSAEVVLVGVPDDAIERTSEGIAGALDAGAGVAHLSGSAPLSALDAAANAGARVLSLHPLQTFPDVERGLERLPESYMAVTATDEDGYLLGEGLASDVGARSFRLPDDRKPMYHAAAVFASNYLAVTQRVAELLFNLAGIEEPVPVFAPLARSTLENVIELGPAEALTGPAARGDAGTIRRNLEALGAEAPHSVPAYVELARAAVHLAAADGKISDEDMKRVEEVLSEWR